MADAQIKLMVATQSHGTVLPIFAQSLALLAGHLTNWGVPHTVLIVEDCLVERGRNRLAASFLDSPCTHLLFLDADLEFRPEDVARLLAADKDVVAGAYLMKDDTGRFAVCLPDGSESGVEYDPEARAVEVEGAGTGFMLIGRRVFEQIRDAMPEIAYLHENPAKTERRIMHAFFETRIEDGQLYSEDYTFCRRWRAVGGRVWACPEIRLRHWGRSVWERSLDSELRLETVPDAEPGADDAADLSAA